MEICCEDMVDAALHQLTSEEYLETLKPLLSPRASSGRERKSAQKIYFDLKSAAQALRLVIQAHDLKGGEPC